METTYNIYDKSKGLNIHENLSEKELVYAVRMIAIKNDDEDMSIVCLSEADEYISVYCENLVIL